MKLDANKHNKLKNTGILFELLSRQITADVMDRKPSSVAENILHRHLSSKTELGKELILYRAFFNTHQLSESQAFDFLKTILEQRALLDEKILAQQKYNLIRDLKENYNMNEFFSVRIPSYKVYASIYKMFSTTKIPHVTVDEIEGVIGSKFTIVEHLTRKSSHDRHNQDTAIMEMVREQDDSLRLLSYNMLLKNFNARYSGLGDKQKNLLREYIYNVSNLNALKKYIVTEAESVSREISQLLPLIENKVTTIKLHEVISQLQNIPKLKLIKENHITAMLIAYQILDELSGGDHD